MNLKILLVVAITSMTLFFLVGTIKQAYANDMDFSIGIQNMFSYVMPGAQE